MISDARIEPQRGAVAYPLEQRPPLFVFIRNSTSGGRSRAYFNADHLLPSVFFQEARDPKDVPLYQDLSLKYIYNGKADPKAHADLMLGSEATWYDVKWNIDRLPRTVDPETVLTSKMEGQLKKWAADRLKRRM